MPHFVIHCAENILQNQSEKKLNQLVYDMAMESGLFPHGNVKVRTLPFSEYIVANEKKDFIHIFGHIMSGRTADQKAALSKTIIAALVPLFPNIPVLSINISEFDKATYFNHTML